MGAVPQAGQRVACGLFAEQALGGEQSLVQIEDAPSGGQAGTQLVGIDRLDQIIIRAGMEAIQHLLLAAASG